MPKITYLKEIDGALWARLELDMSTDEGVVHVFTETEIRKLKTDVRKDVWQTIKDACDSSDDDWRE